MKTDALPTTKKSKQQRVEQIAAGQALVGFFMEYLQNWTQDCLRELNRVRPGLIVPHGNGYRIGPYYIKRLKNLSWLVSIHDEVIHEFHDRASAIIYCVYMCNKNYVRAIQVQQQDSDVYRISNDIDSYQHNQKLALKRQDWFKYDLLATRINESKILLRDAQERLRKTLWTAKYSKVWDRKP